MSFLRLFVPLAIAHGLRMRRLEVRMQKSEEAKLPDDVATVFVYGSLLDGMFNHEVLSVSRLKGLALMEGARMYDLGAFPGVKLVPTEENREGPPRALRELLGLPPKEDVEETDVIVGEVYEVSASTLERLDRLESFHANNPKGSFYVRTERQAQFFGGTTRESWHWRSCKGLRLRVQSTGSSRVPGARGPRRLAPVVRGEGRT